MERQDDSSISGDAILWRRIPPYRDNVQWEEDGSPVPSSLNFGDEENELSLYLASETSIETVLMNHEGFGLVKLTAGDIRKLLGSATILCRDDSDSTPGHVILCTKLSRKQRRDLARNISQWVQHPRREVAF
jgi:hypothetical protein